MAGVTDMLQRARQRVDALRPRYRRTGVWSDRPLDVVRLAASRMPSRVAVRDRSGELTYSELDERIDFACVALTDAGVEASAAVLLVVGNDTDSVVAVHAAIRADAVVLVVPRSAGPKEVSDIVRRTGVSHGVAPNWAGADDVDVPGFTWVAVDAPDGSALKFSPNRTADEPSFVLYTSGTTSRPKGVIHSLSTLAKASSNYIAAAGLGSDDRLFLISPLASVTGVLQALFVAPMLDAPVILEDRWNPADTCDLLVSGGATWYGGPDRLLERVLDEAAANGRAVPLRAVYLGGTMLDRRIIERIENDFGIIVMRAYGSSEVPVSTSGRRIEPQELRHADDGPPLADVEVKVGSVEEPTEFCMRGPHAFLGYIDADDDVQAFNEDWYRTGDVAEITNGRVRIIGRLRDIVIRNGLKIPIAEVEEALGRIADVRDCAAYSVADPTTGERLAVAVLLEPGARLTLGVVADSLISAGLAKYKLPEELVFWDRPLPVNATGKVERNTLQAQSEGYPRAVAERLVLTSAERAGKPGS